MAQIHPHINFNGNAEEAFNFYKSAFGGEFSKVVRFKEISSAEFPIPANEENKLMYISLRIGSNFLMGNDIPEFMGKVSEEENRSKISITAESKEEALNLYDCLSNGGQIEMPLEENPDGTYFAMFRDKFGIEWMIKYDPQNNL
jgi:PhnB protein